MPSKWKDLILFLWLTNADCTDGETGRINGYQRITGSDDDIAYMLQMRQNQVHYIALMDVFAPCIVSSSVWNNDALMVKYCGDNQDNFQEYVLTISDEAFMLLVLVNYAARWAAELQMEKKMVSHYCDLPTVARVTLLTNEHAGDAFDA